MTREQEDNLLEEENLLEPDADGDNENANGEREAAGDDAMDGDNIVASGDAAAQESAARSLNTVKGIKDKKIASENRVTTPYMTKYERARVLGTRALQIRYASKSKRKENRFPRGIAG